MVGPLPEGTLTFLLTDIEGSTPLWEAFPDTMPAALARHDAILNDRIQAHRGHVIRSRGEGDSFFAVFASASDSLAAAAEIQHALAAEVWPTERPIRVRSALHTGEAHLRDGDYFGGDISRCARIRSLAHGGQMLVSHTVSVLVQDCLPDGATLHDLGLHRLKDLQRPERIFQVSLPGLPREFPPLASLDALPHNLPEQLTSFVGRTQELNEVQRLVSGCRLVALTGAGGGGKTRLALQAAAEMLDRFPDGVWLVELATLSQEALLPQAVCKALRLRDDAARTAGDALLEYLHARRLLLVLDNCEHLVDGCARLAEAILRACPHVRVLATSREALGVGGEQAWRVPPLTLPDVQDLPRLKSEVPAVIERSEAVALFLERARSARPEFRVTPENAAAVLQVCHRLDGIPLALELAAARLRHLTVEQVAVRLQDCFRLLTGGARTALPRHRTLRATIDWSYEPLIPSAKVLLHRLSTFSGSWTLEAAEAVGAGDPLSLEEVLDGLSRLVDLSLIAGEIAEGRDPHYRMLQTIRAYAREKLDAEGEGTSAWRRYVTYHRARAAEAEEGLRGVRQAAWLKQLDLELDNFRGALEWSLGHPGDPDAALDISARLFQFWYVRGYLSEGRNWLEQALERGGSSPAALRATALNAVGSLLYQQGDLPSARGRLEAGRALWEELQDPVRAANAANNLGMVYAMTGDFPAAGEAFDAAIRTYRDEADSRRLAHALHNLGTHFLEQGNPKAAMCPLTEAATLHRALRDQWGEMAVARDLGASYRELGDLVSAATLLAMGLRTCCELEDRVVLTDLLRETAAVLAARGEYSLAVQALAMETTTRLAVGLRGSQREERLEDSLLQLLRDAIPVESFEQIWNQTQNTSMEELIPALLCRLAHISAREEESPVTS